MSSQDPSPATLSPPPEMLFGVDIKTICDIFTWTGTFIALGLNLTPIVLFIEVFNKKKTYKAIPNLMLVFNVLCGLFWYCYWSRLHQAVPGYSALSNAIISLIFTYLYLYFATEGKCLYFIVACVIVFDICAQLWYCFGVWIPDPEITGKTAMIINIIQYAAPGQSIFTVLKTGNYSLIPITTTIVGVMCSSCWLIFGIIMKNPNCIIPNSMGLALSLIQIVIYYYFKCTAKKKEDDKGKELVEVKEEEKMA